MPRTPALRGESEEEKQQRGIIRSDQGGRRINTWMWYPENLTFYLQNLHLGAFFTLSCPSIVVSWFSTHKTQRRNQHFLVQSILIVPKSIQWIWIIQWCNVEKYRIHSERNQNLAQEMSWINNDAISLP